MGMDKFGEIDYLANLVQPDVGVITNIGDAHIERLGSRENIFKAKCELLPHMKKDGLLILNGDDALLSTLRGNTPVPAVFCGKGEGLEYQARVTGGDGLSHIDYQLTTPSMEREVKIPALGEHMIYPTMIAAAVAERFGLTADQIEQGLTQFVPTRMRMNILRRKNNITILDDTYNANPQSMRAAINVLADNHGVWKTAVLGDMLELGSFAPALHISVGECLGRAGIDCLVAVGEQSAHIAQGARDTGVPQVYYCKDKEAAKAVLPEIIKPDSTILVKASRGMKLEELTHCLLELTQEG
jgi:UDP-N-acetylmuramoyl-tripeptide--D-alanyl-D-alanine ligase